MLRVFELQDGDSAAFVVAAVDGGIAARGTVKREGGRYQAQVSEGALRDWALEVDGQRSPVVAEGASLSWTVG